MPGVCGRTLHVKRRVVPIVSVFAEAASMRNTPPVATKEKSGGWTDAEFAAPAISIVRVSGSPAVQTLASNDAVTVRFEAIAPHHERGRPSSGGSDTVMTSGFVRKTTLENTGTSTARLKRSRPRRTPVMSGTSTVTGSRRTVPAEVMRHGATAAVKRHPLSASRATVNGNSCGFGPMRAKGSMSSNMLNGSSSAEKMLSET